MKLIHKKHEFTSHDATIIYKDIFGMLEMNSIGVGAISRGLDSEVRSIHPLGSLKSHMHLWTVLERQALEMNILGV
jgi:hypothetical protein